MAPKLGVLPLMLLSWPPHRGELGERTSGAAGHKLAPEVIGANVGIAAEGEASLRGLPALTRSAVLTPAGAP